jgi:hypothetical protein
MRCLAAIGNNVAFEEIAIAPVRCATGVTFMPISA